MAEQHPPERGRQKRQTGVYEVGGIPLNLSVISPGEAQERPTAGLRCNMVAMTTEEMRGWEKLYVDHAMQADTGADLDFLVGSSGEGVSHESR